MPTHPLHQQTESEIRKTFDINVFAQFWILQAFLPHLYAKKRGHIVSLVSVAGLVGLTNLVPYCASKFAVRGLMESLHEELRELNLGHTVSGLIGVSTSPYSTHSIHR